MSGKPKKAPGFRCRNRQSPEGFRFEAQPPSFEIRLVQLGTAKNYETELSYKQMRAPQIKSDENRDTGQ
jgi:hypothetical protein